MTASLYIHVPFCASICDYCDFYSLAVPPGSSILKSYVDQILKDAKELFGKLNVKYIPTVYIGGGTPSVLGASLISGLLRDLSGDIWGKNTPMEITLEANPESCDEDFLSSCRDSGISRISLGLQSFHEPSRQAVQRAGEAGLLEERLKAVSMIYPQNFSVDIISGLPFQDENILHRDIEKLLAFNPAHVSLYSLSIGPETPLGRRVTGGQVKVPSEDEADSLWIKGRDILESCGYKQYEVSNFSLPRKESLHNLRYWRMENWLGLGPAASGTIINDEAKTGLRFTVPADIDLWLDRKNQKDPPGSMENLDTLTLIKDTFLMGFRLLEGPEASLFQHRFNRGIEETIPRTIRAWRDKGLFQEDKIALTKAGLLLLNTFLVEAFQELDETLVVSSP